MTDWQRVRELFDALADLPAADRGEALARLGAEDATLEARLRTLLDADHGGDRAAFECDVAGIARGLFAAPLPAGSIVGGYRVTGVLGAGGMGTVYLAEQGRPRRTVALKVMHTGLASDDARRRFEFEADVLARLSHPGVAEVFAAGTHHDETTGADLPYYVMEHVDGAHTLDRHVAEHRPDLTALLRLFLDVCDAVQHGHRLGVLHRDLKPANVLVDRHHRPKVIDFGIARALPDARDARTALTDAGQVLGTVVYMAPERLRDGGAPPDVRADVYSLGVTLYELLTGELPFATTAAALAAAVDGQRPQPLSQRRGDLPVDLDWIVERAMATAPDERYGTVSELGADITRLLEGRPVLAGPPSTAYALRKFVRRNRAAVVFASAAALAVATGSVVAAIGWMRASAAEGLAVQRAEVAEREGRTQLAVTEYLTALIEAARDDRDGRDVRVIDLMQRADAELDDLYRTRPEVAAGVARTVAVTYATLGLFERARAHLERLLPVAAERLGPLHPTTLHAGHVYGYVLGQLGDPAAAEDVLRRTLADRTAVHGADSDEVAHTRQCLGSVLRQTGRLAEAAAELRAARVGFARLWGEVDARTLSTELSEVQVQREQGDLPGAEARMRPLLQRIETASGPDAALTISAHSTLGQVLSDAGRPLEAEPHLRTALVSARRLYGADSSRALGAENDLAVTLQRCGRLDEAIECLRRVVAGRRSDPASALIDRHNLASTLERSGRASEALPEFEQLMRDAPEALPAGHWLLGQFHKSYGVCLDKLGRRADAERELLAGLAGLEASFPAADRRVQAALRALTDLYDAAGQTERAATYRSRLQ